MHDRSAAVDEVFAEAEKLIAEHKRQPLPAVEFGQQQQEPKAAFSQQDHDLLLASIDHVAEDWIAQLQQVRRNSEEIERLVLQRAAKVKADITQLYLLGSTAMQEARRGEQVNEKLATELEKLAEEPAQ